MTDPSGVTKGAILMLALGEEGASEVMKYLGPREVQKLGEAMTSMKSIAQEEVENVLHDFNHVADQNSSLGVDSDDYIRSVLKKALGDDKANSLLNRILGGGGDTGGIESLKWMDAESVADLIHNEHPQT
ncbi:MAG TPA: flagellar motor switch protein FliG, partial [Thiobacillus sp.]